MLLCAYLFIMQLNRNAGVVVCVVLHRCVEMLINEQMRRYIERMEEIEQLEYAETLAKNQLKLKRSNTVRAERMHTFVHVQTHSCCYTHSSV